MDSSKWQKYHADGDWFWNGRALLCAHHNSFWTTIVDHDRADFVDLDGALAHIADVLGLDGLPEPAGVRERGLGAK